MHERVEWEHKETSLTSHFNSSAEGIWESLGGASGHGWNAQKDGNILALAATYSTRVRQDQNNRPQPQLQTFPAAIGENLLRRKNKKLFF